MGMGELKPCYGECDRCAWKPNGGCSAWNGFDRRVGCEAAAEYAKGNRPKDGTWPGEEGEKG